ncbi:MAG: putative cobalt-precorrin-6Y C(15)-methyltransferase [decarboxylating] [ANME-2 cluster archaeon HR1]|nr:MAG: putative cobalt-precorrin-6Y C(15)-methyltransferase [decarboxylating] [ANME-2 cluster archaeon HR1]
MRIVHLYRSDMYMELVSGGPTKPEIAALALFKLNISHGDVFADIGSGTAYISIMAARIVKCVYAVDSRYKAISAAQKNIRNANINNIKLIRGEAPAILDELPLLDCAFIGGTRNIESVLQALVNKVNGRIVVNVVRIQTASTVINIMQDLGIFVDAVLVQVSNSYELAGEIAFKPINPVYIITGDTKGDK